MPKKAKKPTASVVLQSKEFWQDLQRCMGACTNTHAVTLALLRHRFKLSETEVHRALETIKSYGGCCCDCEVLLNAAERILSQKKFEEYFPEDPPEPITLVVPSTNQAIPLVFRGKLPKTAHRHIRSDQEWTDDFPTKLIHTIMRDY